MEVLLREAHAPATGIVHAVREALADFSGDTPPFDDITAVLVKYNKPSRPA
jgi:serine phosphatase RsbU (regulator of sigma subunit)